MPTGLPDEPFALTYIDLSEIREVGDADLQRFTGLHSLGMLNLAETNVGDEGAAHLSDLPELVYLNLVGTRVTGKGIVNLAGLPQLTQLYVSRCPIRDEVMPHLRAMKLDQLTLDGTEITFAGLKNLAGNESLRALTVVHLGLTQDEVQELSDLLPQCTIRSDYGSSGPEEAKE